MSKLFDKDKLFKELFTDNVIKNYDTLKEIILINPYLFEYLASTKYITFD